MTVLFGRLLFLILPKDVSSARYLDPQEMQALVSILELDAGAVEVEENLSGNAVWSAFRSIQVWLVFVQLFANGGESSRFDSYTLLSGLLCRSGQH